MNIESEPQPFIGHMTFCIGKSQNQKPIMFQVHHSFSKDSNQTILNVCIKHRYHRQIKGHNIRTETCIYMGYTPVGIIPSFQDFIHTTARFLCCPKHHKHFLQGFIPTDALPSLIILRFGNKHRSGIGKNERVFHMLDQ